MKINNITEFTCRCGGWADSIFGKCNRCGKSAILF